MVVKLVMVSEDVSINEMCGRRCPKNDNKITKYCINCVLYTQLPLSKVIERHPGIKFYFCQVLCQ